MNIHFPTWRYHPTEPAVIVNTLAAFDAPRPAAEPTKKKIKKAE